LLIVIWLAPAGWLEICVAAVMLSWVFWCKLDVRRMGEEGREDIRSFARCVGDEGDQGVTWSGVDGEKVWWGAVYLY